MSTQNQQRRVPHDRHRRRPGCRGKLLCEATATFSAGVYSTTVPTNLPRSDNRPRDLRPDALRGNLRCGRHLRLRPERRAGDRAIGRANSGAREDHPVRGPQPCRDRHCHLGGVLSPMVRPAVCSSHSPTTSPTLLWPRRSRWRTTRRSCSALRTPCQESVREEALRAMGGPGEVVLLGGTAALADSIATTFEGDGHTVSRAAGDSRFSTSVEVARAANPNPSTIFLAFGGDFPDALIAGATAPTFGGVAVLVDRTGIPRRRPVLSGRELRGRCHRDRPSGHRRGT